MAEIYGGELVTGIFGHWPSFHDAEVVRMSLERTAKYQAGPLLLADVHTFEMTSDIDAQGRITFKEIAPSAFPEPSYEIVFEGVHGVSTSFRCREVMVVGVQPWDVETGAPAA